MDGLARIDSNGVVALETSLTMAKMDGVSPLYAHIISIRLSEDDKNTYQ